jgi:hypothetical protein
MPIQDGIVKSVRFTAENKNITPPVFIDQALIRYAKFSGQRRLEVGFNPLLTFHSYLGTLFLMKPLLHTGFHAGAFPAKLLERSELLMPRPKRFFSL